MKLSSGSKILLTISLKARITLKKNCRRVEGGILNNISPPNISPTTLLLERYHQNCKADFGCCGRQWVNLFASRLNTLPDNFEVNNSSNNVMSEGRSTTQQEQQMPVICFGGMSMLARLCI